MTNVEEKLKRLLDALIPLVGWERAAEFVIRTDRKAVEAAVRNKKS